MRLRTKHIPNSALPARADVGEPTPILPYDALRTGAQPDEALLAFLQSTYEAAANAAKWDRDALECAMGRPGQPRKVG
jgi:hypothetical protein